MFLVDTRELLDPEVPGDTVWTSSAISTVGHDRIQHTMGADIEREILRVQDGNKAWEQ